LVLPVIGAQGLPRGARLRVRLGQIDEVTLDVTGTVLARLDTLPENDSAVLDCDEDEVDGNVAVGPIAIAVDMNDADAAAGAAASDE
jgi:exoribonuclease-2